MNRKDKIKLFQEQAVRSHWDEKQEKWYFSVVDVVDTEQILRLIQSIPSKKAEPFKRWLAKTGSERIDETDDPELAFDRAMQAYIAKGYSKEWVNQRLKSIEVRKELTDEWAVH